MRPLFPGTEAGAAEGQDVGVRLEPGDDGIAHVVFDRPRRSVNLLGRELLLELDRILDLLTEQAPARGVLFRSAKPRMFIAGMDVEEIAAAQDGFEASEGARAGQRVFQKIADLPVPTACAIGGPCLGGGLELALACTVRVASDSPAVEIGLPEVQLGIVPGFGGTQRLPRLVGLASALDLILTGRRLDGRRALRIGLVDRVVPEAYLEREAAALLREVAAGGSGPRSRRRRPAWSRLLEGVGPLRRLVLARARKRTAARVSPEAYPAPFRALDAVEAAFALPLAQGLDLEARIVGELLNTRTAANLIWIFRSQRALKKDPAGVEAPPRRVRRVAVVGAGIMGGGIAQLVADRDVPVRLKDIRQEALLAALRTARGVWEERVRRGRLGARELRQKIGYISTTLDDTGLSKVDLVVEAVVEKLEVKQQVLAAVEERIGERAVFATNTSSIPISEIAARALRPERVVGLHFFNPVHRMPLVEVIAGQRSSPEAVATARAFALELGKTPVLVRDSPGFLVNRILTAYLNEAMRLLGEGVPTEAVDGAMSAFGMPVGPLALLDQVGLDTALHVGRVLEAAFGKRIGGGSVLAAMVDSGRLGSKSGRGFFRYRDGRRAGPDRQVYRLIEAPPARSLPAETLQERMVLAMVNEAAVCLEDGVAREPRDVDLAMVLGTGFPPFRGGPLRYADSLGIAVVVDRLSRLADAHGERFRPAGLLREMVRQERTFYPEGRP